MRCSHWPPPPPPPWAFLLLLSLQKIRKASLLPYPISDVILPLVMVMMYSSMWCDDVKTLNMVMMMTANLWWWVWRPRWWRWWHQTHDVMMVEMRGMLMMVRMMTSTMWCDDGIGWAFLLRYSFESNWCQSGREVAEVGGGGKIKIQKKYGAARIKTQTRVNTEGGHKFK